MNVKQHAILQHWTSRIVQSEYRWPIKTVSLLRKMCLIQIIIRLEIFKFPKLNKFMF